MVFWNKQTCGLGLQAQTLANIRVPDFQEPIKLEDGDLTPIRGLYDQLVVAEKSDGSDDLDIAFRRFNQAYTRQDSEDRVLDYTIALESSLLRGIREELRYRLSVRGAALTCRKADPTEIQSLLIQIYDARSGIVHDGKMLADRELAKRCGEVVRLILRCYLDRIAAGESISTINVNLDRLLILSLPRT